MSALPEITVAMSMHNASCFLRECIDSVLAQTFADFEFLIVDDGSADGSADIVRSYADPRIRLLCRPHDFIASLNTLLAEARGRYIARMDADDVMMPDRLRIQYDYLESHPEVAAVCSQAVRIDSHGQPIGQIGSGMETIRITPRLMCETNHVCNPTTMMRRDIIESGNMRYESEYEYAEDYRFWSRVVTEIGSIDCLPQQLLHYRVSDKQVTATHWDEMMEATERIKSDLIATLVNKANPNYNDPVINESGCELTLIIPFLNEGEEVENTIRSFREFGGDRMEIIVINDCSYDSYPYMERLTAIPGVTYILNRERLGVAASRDKGVSLCRTPYFLLLDAHMRAYDDLWVSEIPRLLRENDRRILCCQTRFLIRKHSGEIIVDPKSPITFGARMTFRHNQLMPGIEWNKDEKDPAKLYERIQCVLGAGYATSCRYWDHIAGLNGLRQYGFDEQMLSLKTWLDGGECLLLKKAVLGHIYREEMPYEIRPQTMMYNALYITETLFPIKERCKARAAAYLYNREQFIDTFRELKETLRNDSQLTNKTIDSKVFDSIITFNRTASRVDSQLAHDIQSRLPEIAQEIIDHQPSSSGLFDGSVGQALWLFLYSRLDPNPAIKDHASTLLNYGLSHLPMTDMSFSTGLSGVAWAIRFLDAENFHHLDGYLLEEIDDILCHHLDNLDSGNPDITLAKGLCGIVACQTLNPKLTEQSKANSLIDKVSSIILSSHDIGFSEAYYALLWMQLRNSDNRRFMQIKHKLTDWTNPSPFIPKDHKFWNMSLFDGILATSASYL